MKISALFVIILSFVAAYGQGKLFLFILFLFWIIIYENKSYFSAKTCLVKFVVIWGSLQSCEKNV
jgi:hypothetical protein